MGKISDMVAASALTGAEQVEVVQSGATRRTTVGDVIDGLQPAGDYVQSTDVNSIVLVEESDWPPADVAGVMYVKVEDEGS
jgi:hypothetical protein